MNPVADKGPGRISLLMRVLPDDVGTDLKGLEADIRKDLPSGMKLEATEIKPFAFGLKALVCAFNVSDEEGNADKLEEHLRGIPKVQGVEFLKMSRVIS